MRDQVMRDFLAVFSFPDIPAHIADRVRVEQMNQLAYMTSIMALAGINTLLVLLVAFFGRLAGATLVIAFTGIPVFYAAVLHYAWGWRNEPEPGANAGRAIRRQTRLIAVLGFLWALLLIGLIPVADAGQRSLLYSITVGAISTAVLCTPALAAFAFWVPVTIAGFASLAASGHSTDALTAACLFGYALLTLFCTMYLNRNFIERVLNEVGLEEQGEVIGLLLREFEESSSDWLWETDAQLRLKHVSARLAQVARAPAASLSGSYLLSLVGGAGSTAATPEPLLRLARCLSDRAAFRDLSLPVRIEGEERWWSLTGKPVFDKRGTFAGYRGVGSDVTAAKQSEERIAYLARYDSLTGLPNRVLFNDALQRACGDCRRQGMALLCLDLDEFKSVNDTLGHATGDALLVAVADRLRGCVREGDVAARLGGDEFAVLLAAATQAEAEATAGRIVERVGQPYWFDGVLVEIGVSIGVTLAPADGTQADLLLKNADLALYRAKADGRGTWRFFEAAMDERVQERRSLQADLRHALARGEFRLEFQPIADLATLRIDAAEALLRWHHPERGVVASPDFIPVAEEAGLIVAIGEWVIRQACQEAVRWPEPVAVAVNLSAVQFRDAGLVGIVAGALAASGLAASRLELEITESIFLATNEQTLDSLHRLRALGVRIALDDFGTGYSSLSYLRSFPFDKLKIDRSFIRDLGRTRDAAAIIEAITSLAASMGMVTTAEGVETEEQLALLRACGCTQMQGFLLSRPKGAVEVARIIQESQRAGLVRAPLDVDL